MAASGSAGPPARSGAPRAGRRAVALAALALLPAVLGIRGASGQTYPVRESRPPVRDFFEKYVDCNGLFIRAAGVVQRGHDIRSDKTGAAGHQQHSTSRPGNPR